MKRNLLIYLAFCTGVTWGQDVNQDFDGADTLACCSIFIELDTAAENNWQIGPPTKELFDSPFSPPNVLVTDTINPYADNVISRFNFEIELTEEIEIYGIYAMQWTQKIDIDSINDIGYIEYSGDGEEWESVFGSPNVYSFYGYGADDVDTTDSGIVGFQGTNNTWEDIWLCFDLSWMSSTDTFRLRYTLESDTVENEGHDGWMIDNLSAHITWFHTINENEQDNYLEIFPNPTYGVVNIQARKTTAYHVIEEMQLMDINGKIIREYGLSPTKFEIDLRDLPDGVYILKIRTNMQTETFKIIREPRN